ncbi:MAG: enoyl-CoA hydratase-related protein [Acidobacteriota bacterium]
MSAPIRYVVEAGVARITLDRPDVFNALSLELLGALAERVGEAVLDDAVGALLITGAGKAFSAGGDVRSLSALAAAEQPGRLALDAVGRMHKVLVELFRCPKPVVAAVNGAVAGAGVGLMLTADVIWASEEAHVTLAFTGIGASPDGGTTYLLPRVVGPKLAAELLLTNRRLDAGDALAAGLFSRVLGVEELASEALEVARGLARGPSSAYAASKELLRRSLLRGYEAQLEDERQVVARSIGGAEFREGVAAFLEKRPPRFR